MAVNYTDVQKTEKYISRTNFDALEMAAVPEGTEFNIVDPIHESDLDSDVLQKLNNNAKINTANTFTAAQTFKKDITIEGNIIQNGSTYETHAEKIYTKNDMIYTRDGATAALADNTYTGIQAVKYDGTNDGQLVFGKDGVARVGDVGNTQPLATRAEAGAIVDKHLLQWDAARQTLIDSGKSVNDLEGGGGDVTAAGNNTFTGSNTFTKDFSVYDEVSGNKSTLGYSALTLKDPVAHNTCMLSPAGLVHKQMSNDETITLHNTTLAFENAGSTTTITVPNKTGILALTTDIPVANPTDAGTVTLTKLKVGDVVYTIPSGGSGGKLYAHSVSGKAYESSDTNTYNFVFYSTDSEKLTYDNVATKKIPFAFLYQISGSGDSSFLGIITVGAGGPPNTITVDFPGIFPVSIFLTNISSGVTEV